MQTERTILCGGLPLPAKSKVADPIRLHLLHGPPEQQVNLRIAQLNQTLLRNLPAVYHDLVEIAAYVYAADQAVRRSGQDTDTFGARWRQSLHFHVPVRCLDFWQRTDVVSALAEVLSFLGDHFFAFNFYRASNPVEFQQYLDLQAPDVSSIQYNQVAMFSGGLDSLAGAIDEIVQERNQVAFVTHIPTTKNIGIIRRLRKDLDGLAGPSLPLHVGVEVNKSKSLGKEYTQRTRSFLFASLGAAVAQMLGLHSLRFYENGVISLNLPVCAQVVGGRATRTTHPRVLAGFSRLFSLVSESNFEVTNPYLWHTKADVVRRIINAGQGALIARSVSCAHTWERTIEHNHCGLCSQCLDRRLAMLTAGAYDLDPPENYKFNIFTQTPSKDADRILTASYIERARTLKDIASPTALISQFPEAARALGHIPGVLPHQAAQRIFDLHTRHGREIEAALSAIITRHAPEIVNRSLPGDCLIRIVTDSGMTAPSPDFQQPVELPDSYLWRRGNVWEFRFEGGTAFPIQHHEKGCAYLQVLLRNQGDSMSVEEVRAAVAVDVCDMVLDGALSEDELNSESFGITYGLPKNDAGDALTETAIKKLRDELGLLRDRLADAKEFGNDAEQAQIEEEMGEILRSMNRDMDKQGRSRKVQDLRKNERDAMRNNIDRTIKEIREHDAALADHLADRRVLRLGVENRYVPNSHISWAFSPPTVVEGEGFVTELMSLPGK